MVEGAGPSRPPEGHAAEGRGQGRQQQGVSGGPVNVFDDRGKQHSHGDEQQREAGYMGRGAAEAALERARPLSYHGSCVPHPVRLRNARIRRPSLARWRTTEIALLAATIAG